MSLTEEDCVQLIEGRYEIPLYTELGFIWIFYAGSFPGGGKNLRSDSPHLTDAAAEAVNVGVAEIAFTATTRTISSGGPGLQPRCSRAAGLPSNSDRPGQGMEARLTLMLHVKIVKAAFATAAQAADPHWSVAGRLRSSKAAVHATVIAVRCQ